MGHCSFGAWLAETKDSWRSWEQSAVSALDSTASSLGAVLMGTEKAGDAARKLVSNFAEMAISAAFKSLFGSVIGSTGDGAGGAASGLLGSLGACLAVVPR